MQIRRIRTKFMSTWVVLKIEFCELAGRQPPPAFEIKSYERSNSMVTDIFALRISMFESYVMHEFMRLGVVEPLSLWADAALRACRLDLLTQTQ